MAPSVTQLVTISSATAPTAEGLLDAEESARNDALVVAEEGAGQHDDRDDARSARERKSIGDRIGEFRARTAAGTA